MDHSKGCHLHIYDNTFGSVATVRFHMFDISADQTRDYISLVYLIRKWFMPSRKQSSHQDMLASQYSQYSR
jgi:hypothetical protein